MEGGIGFSTSVVHFFVGVLFLFELILGYFLHFLVNVGVVELPFFGLLVLEGIIVTDRAVFICLLHAMTARVEIIVEVVVIHHLLWWLCPWSAKYRKGVYWCRWVPCLCDWIGGESI